MNAICHQYCAHAIPILNMSSSFFFSTLSSQSPCRHSPQYHSRYLFWSLEVWSMDLLTGQTHSCNRRGEKTGERNEYASYHYHHSVAAASRRWSDDDCVLWEMPMQCRCLILHPIGTLRYGALYRRILILGYHQKSDSVDLI